MQLGRRVRVHAGSGCAAGDPNLNLFTATLAQNAGLPGRVLMPPMAAPCVIRDIQVVSVDGNIWEWWFFANSLFNSGDINEKFRGYYPMTVGLQVGGAGLFHATQNAATGAPTDIYYEDDDAAGMTPPPAGVVDPAWRAANGQTGTYLNALLVNRSAGAKTVNGWFDVTFVCEPVLGW